MELIKRMGKAHCCQLLKSASTPSRDSHLSPQHASWGILPAARCILYVTGAARMLDQGCHGHRGPGELLAHITDANSERRGVPVQSRNEDSQTSRHW
jgi:hypothetical protein